MDPNPRETPPARRDDPYAYVPALPDAPTPADRPAEPHGPAGNGAADPNPPAAAQRAPGPVAVGSASAWEWRGAAASPPPASPPPPPPGGWYTVVGPAPARPTVHEQPGQQAGGWRRSAIGRWLGRLWPLVLLALSKAKWLLVIFKLKAFTTFGSLLLSLGFYALAFGLPFAAGFIALLFIHEMGHALVMRRQGIKTTPVLFIPFMGAVIGMKEMPKNVYAEAQMALGGPIVGSLGALGSLALWQATGAPIFVALTMVGLWLNLFNLIPVSPLDGGRAMAAISPWGWLIGLALLLALFLRVHSLFLGFILLVGGVEVFNRWRSRSTDRAYYEATPRQRLIITAVYFGLAITLALGIFALQGHVLAGQPIR